MDIVGGPNDKAEQGRRHMKTSIVSYKSRIGYTYYTKATA